MISLTSWQYKIFAASAMAAASCSRSLFGAVLPFATTPMYKNLGVPWACSVLGFLSIAMSVIPFVFIWKGDWLRQKSKFCQYLAERERMEQEEQERKAKEEELSRRGQEIEGSSEVEEKHQTVDERLAGDGKEKDMV